MVQETPSLTIAELGHYWADLTTKEGACFKNFSVNGCTELEFAIAFEAGKAHLPPGDDDALLAYFFNAAPLYIAYFQKYPPREKKELKTETLFAQYLLTHDMPRSLCVLQVLGSLEAISGENCRLVTQKQLQISWGKNLYLQIPFDYDNCLNFIVWELKQQHPAMYQAFINGLTLLNPEQFSQVPIDVIDPRLIEIYQALKQKKDYWSIFRYLSLLASAGYNPVDSKMVLDLPDQISFIEKTKQFDKQMPRLRAAYKNSRFAPVLEAACGKPSAPRQAAVEAMRVCTDAEVLSFAWQLEDEKRVDFLLDAASTMPLEALPFALNHIIKNYKEDKKLIEAYLERLKRTSSAINTNYEPILLGLLLDLGPQLSMETAGEVMDQLGKCSSLVRSTVLVRNLAELLVRENADSALWSKFQSLLRTVVGDARFIEDVIVALETVAGIPAAASCFEVSIPQLGKRKPDQKQRIVLAFATAIQLQTDPEMGARMIGALPEGWLSGQLRKEETWEAFANVLLCSTGRKDFAQSAIPDALWVAPHLLSKADSPLFARFEALVLRFSIRQLGDEWKPHLARMLVRNGRNSLLLTKLMELAAKTEKRVLQECQTLQQQGQIERVRGCMSSFIETGTFKIPKPSAPSLSEQFQNALKDNNLSLALSLLGKMKGPDWELWGQLFEHLPEKPECAFAAQGWSTWVEKHPIADHKPEHDPYWSKAIERLFINVDSDSPIVSNFITTRAEKIAATLGKENREILIGGCLELGTAACWNKQCTQPAAVLRALLPFCSDTERIKEHFEDCFYLMLANQAEADLYEIGNRWYLERIGKTPGDPAIFKAYSLRPYLPRSREDQIRSMGWITACLSNFHSQISWIEKYRIFSVMCKGSFETHTEQEKVDHFAKTAVLWDNLLISLHQEQRTNPKCANLFYTATLAYMDAIMQHLPNKLNKYNGLVALRKGFLEHTAKYCSQETAVAFRLNNCFHMFSLLPFDFDERSNHLAQSLVDFNDCVIHFIHNKKTELPNHVSKLILYFGHLLNHPHPQIIPSLKVVLENLMESSVITKAKGSTPSIWSSILKTLCLGMLTVRNENHAEAVKMVSQLFSYCTRPSLDRQFIDSSVDMLGSLFLANPHLNCLSDEDWKGLIGSQSLRSVRRLMAILRKEIKGLSIAITYNSSAALARVICHANSLDKAFLNELVEHCQLGTGPHFSKLCKNCEPLLYLRLHSGWIRAISSLSKKCSLDKALIERKIAMTRALTDAVCELIVDGPSYHLYSPFLMDAMSDDFQLEVTKLVHSLLPESSVSELNDLKAGLKQVLELVK